MQNEKGFWGKTKEFFNNIGRPIQPIIQVNKKYQASYKTLFTYSYNGEKNLGELGPIIDYRLDYAALRMRSWQSYLESEVTQTVIRRFVVWVIGSGLKLQANPNKVVLESEGISIEPEKFNRVVEGRFGVYFNSKMADHSGLSNLAEIAQEAYINSIIGGDVLVVLRVIDGRLTVQLVDGAHLTLGIENSNFNKEATNRGNYIKDGIEFNSKGGHVAFYIKSKNNKIERVEAIGKKSKRTMAFLIIGSKYRLDNKRGLPLIGAMLETLKKLERYKEATVGSAEERQKIPYYIKHEDFSTGENPLQQNIMRAMNADAVTDDIPTDDDGNELATTIAATTNKQVFNMPKGADLNFLDTKNELSFKDFYSTNIELVCASIGIPPEVALSKYDSNFSSSRAALKDWEHTITVARKKFQDAFYLPIYKLWLELEIINNKVEAPGFLSAIMNKNLMAVEAYFSARFTGPTVPHIDPLKEVNAERAKLGSMAAHLPLTTVEQATENLNGGESDSNMEQFSEEIKDAEGLGLKPQPTQSESIPPKEEKDEEDQ